MDSPHQAPGTGEPSDDQLASELIHLSVYGGPTRPGAFDGAPVLRSLTAEAGLADTVAALLDLLDRAFAKVERSDLREVGLAAFRRPPYDDDLLEDRLDRCAHELAQRLIAARRARGQIVQEGKVPVPSAKTMGRRRAALIAELVAILRARQEQRPPRSGADDDDTNDPRLIPGDRSEFVGDISVPDGTMVRHRQVFTKQWEIRNAGIVPWIGRYLTRQGATEGYSVPKTPSRVRVSDTLPGRSVVISMEVQAPEAAGTYQIHWKMTEAGRQFFPDQYWGGLWFNVVVPGPH